MEQMKAVCAIILVMGFCTSLLQGARIRCVDNSECPEDHCCLAVGEDFMCTKLRTLGQFCQPDGESDNQDHQSVYTVSCPCMQGLVCSDAATSSSEGSDSSASSGEHSVCQSAEPEKDEGPAE